MLPRCLAMIAMNATGGEIVDGKLTAKDINKAVRVLKKNKASYPEGVWCRYDGQYFHADNLDNLRLKVIDYITKQELVKGVKAYCVDEWRDATIGKMPTWPSIPMNFAEVLHMKIPPLPENISWHMWRIRHQIRYRIDCQG